MSRRRSATLWGVVSGYAAILVALIRNIVLVPLYLHYVDIGEYGAWLATGGALALMLINDFGVAGVVMQRVAAAAGAEDRAELGPLIGSSLAVGFLLAIILTLISLLLTPFLSGLEGLNDEERHRVLDCFLIAIGANATGVFAATAIGIVRSLQRQLLAGVVSVSADLLGIAFTLLALLRAHGLYAIAGGLAVRSLVLALASVLAALWIAKGQEGARPELSRLHMRRLTGDSTRFFLSAIAMKVQTQANTLLAAFTLGPASAAIYGLTVRAHETVLQLVYQINGALVPATSHLYGAGEHERFRSLILRLLPALGFITAIGMTVVAATNESFIRLWVGSDRFGGLPTSWLMSFALWVASLGSVAYDAMLAQGRFSAISRVYALSSAVHVALLLCFLRMGMWIAPLATLLSSSLWSLWFWRSLGKDLRLNRSTVIALARSLAGVALSAVTVVALVQLAWPLPAAWSGFVLQVVGCALAFVSLTLLMLPDLRALFRDELTTTFRTLASR